MNTEKKKTVKAPSNKVRRLALAILALGSELVITVLRVLWIAIPLALTCYMYPYALIIGASVFAVLFFAWLLRPSFTVPEGRILTPDEVPKLYELVDQVRETLSVPGQFEIRLDDSLNAAALQTRGLFGLFGTKNVLYLGLPLLSTLPEDELKGVIAHELGHFSRRHGRLGHWLYRANIGWRELSQHIDESDSPLDRSVAWVATRIAPKLLGASFNESRACEYEADADAASVVGPQVMINALSRIAALSLGPRKQWAIEEGDWLLSLESPPDDICERMAKRATVDPAHLRAGFEQALAEAASDEDTHPSLRERAEALGVVPTFDSLLGPVRNGLSILEPQWDTLRDSVNQAWREERQTLWRANRVVALANLKKASEYGPEKIAYQAWVNPAAHLSALREYVAAHPNALFAQYTLGALSLAEDQEEGVTLLESVSRSEFAYRPKSFSKIRNFYERQRGSRFRGERAKRQAWATTAWTPIARALDQHSIEIETIQTPQTRLNNDQCRDLVAFSEGDITVRALWVFSDSKPILFRTDKPAAEATLHAMLVLVDPVEIERLALSRSAIESTYGELLDRLLPPTEFCFVRVFYSTENGLACMRPETAIYHRSSRV